jgi:hypothetical protein
VQQEVEQGSAHRLALVSIDEASDAAAIQRLGNLGLTES